MEEGDARGVPRAVSSRVPAAGTLLVVLWAAAVLVTHVLSLRRHLDVHDEAFWLELVAHPDAARHAGEVFLAQFPLHHVFVVAGEDIVVFRWFGYGMVLASAAFLVWSVLRALGRASLQVARGFAIVVYALVLASSILVSATGGRSFGFRAVAITGMCVVVGGLALALSDRPGLGGAVGGAGLVVTATGRPTSALALALVVLAAAAAGGRLSLRLIGGGLLGGLGTAGGLLLVARMTPPTVVAFLQGGYDDIAAGTAHDSLATMLGMVPSPVTSMLLFGPLLALPLVIAAWSVVRGPGPSAPRAVIEVLFGLVIVTFSTIIAVAVLSARGYGDQILPLTQVVLLLAIGLAACVGVVSRGPSPQGDRGRPEVPGSSPLVPWLLLPVLGVAPYLASLGTNTQMVYNMAQACLFWVLAAAVTARMLAVHWPVVESLVVTGAVLVLSIVTTAQVVLLTDNGDRSILAATTPADVLGGEIAVIPAEAGPMDRLAELRREYHLEDQPSIDLTGFATGYQLQLGTRPLGHASFFGFFEGADRSARAALAKEPCRDRARAWLLYARDNPLDVSEALTSGTTLDLERDYQQVARFTAVPYTGDPVTVRVLRPGPRVGAALGCPQPQ